MLAGMAGDDRLAAFAERWLRTMNAVTALQLAMPISLDVLRETPHTETDQLGRQMGNSNGNENENAR